MTASTSKTRTNSHRATPLYGALLIAKLMRTMNNAATSPLELGLLAKSIDMWWPELEAKIEAIKAEDVTPTHTVEIVRSEREILLELLDTVRGLARAQADTHDPFTRSSYAVGRDFTENFLSKWGSTSASDVARLLAQSDYRLAQKDLTDQRTKLAKREMARAEEAAWEALQQDDPPLADGEKNER